MILLQEIIHRVRVANFMLDRGVFGTVVEDYTADTSIKVLKGSKELFLVEIYDDIVFCGELGISYHKESLTGQQVLLHDIEETLAHSVFLDFKRKYQAA